MEKTKGDLWDHLKSVIVTPPPQHFEELRLHLEKSEVGSFAMNTLYTRILPTRQVQVPYIPSTKSD